MPLIKRIGFYLLGFSIGVVFLAFFFKEKRTEFCYMPNCRVLKELRSKPLEFAVNQEGLTPDDVNQIFTEGDVLFSKSDTHALPCKIYVVKGKTRNGEWLLTTQNCTEKVVIIAAERTSK
ncbi:MAG: DUF4258 domain-containing protein [Capnocytophaga sp.]|nr:DUF4258 domain-containing protein [Capnocytophaga sp.]